MKASFNGQVVAESDDTVVIEGNHYFPPESVNKDFLTNSETKTTCHWKGEANYHSVTVDGETATDGAWVYHAPSDAAAKIKGYLAFWNGVEVTED